MRKLRNPFTVPLEPLDIQSLETLKHLPVNARLERLERNDATTVVERKRIVGLQRSQLWGVVSTILLLVAVAGLLYKRIDGNTSNAVTAAQTAQTVEKALTTYQVASCKRGNLVRVAANRSAYDDYRFFSTTAALIRDALVKTEQTSPRRQANEAAKVAEGYVTLLESFAADKEWGHLIVDCRHAVEEPSLYVFAPPQRFETFGSHGKRALHLPPRSVLTVAPGE